MFRRIHPSLPALGRWLSIGLVLLLPQPAPGITPGEVYPASADQYSLQLINRARTSADGLAVLATLVTNNLAAITPSTTRNSQNGTPWSAGFWTSAVPGIADGMNYFRVHPGDLKRQYLDLAIPGEPLAWQANLGNVAAGYNDLVITNQGAGPGFPHDLAPYNDQSTVAALAARYLDGGYGPLSELAAFGENIAPDGFSNPLSVFTAYMIDWGSTADGIQDQDPEFGSHRLNLMDPGFAEIGLSMKPGWTSGRATDVQEFGARFSNPPRLVGAVYFDTDQNNFYTPGEGLGGTRVRATPVNGGTPRETVTQRNGGYTLDLATPGDYTITAIGGFGVFAAGTVTISDRNVLLNIATPLGQEACDFSRNDKPDLLLHSPTTRRTSIWYLNGGVKTGEAEGPSLATTQPGWIVAGVADFNADGYADYCLYNSSTLKTVIWYLNGSTKIDRADAPVLSTGWSIVGLEDFNRDGYPDYLLYHSGTRNTAIWYMRGATKIGSAPGPSLSGVSSGWTIAGTADFNLDGKPDLLLYNLTTRNTVVWFLDNNVRIDRADGPTLSTVSAGWTVAGTADFNADNWPDLLLYDSSTRKTVIWYLNGTIKVNRADGPFLPAGWQLAAP